jgi:hypothetical protein
MKFRTSGCRSSAAAARCKDFPRAREARQARISICCLTNLIAALDIAAEDAFWAMRGVRKDERAPVSLAPLPRGGAKKQKGV